jgi:cytochrome c553
MKRFSQIVLVVVCIVFGFAAVSTAGKPTAKAKPGVPETITIDGLSHWFGPVAFPHAEHVDMAGECTTCHHHTDGEPATCDTCHSKKVFNPESPDIPSLKVAYHTRCVGCHQENGGPTKCEACHARKALPTGVKLGAFPRK